MSFDVLGGLLVEAKQQQVGIDVDAAFERTVAASAVIAPPLLADGLLSDDEIAVAGWIGQIYRQVLAASGLSERDALEEGVAACAYLVTFCVVLAMLIQMPLFATVAGLTGFAAHPPAKVTSNLARRGFVALNEL